MKDRSIEIRRFIEKVFRDGGEEVPGGLEKLVVFVAHLLFWNERFRLTGFKSVQNIVESGVYSSSRIARYLRAGERIVDIGSGGGFPGLVLAALLPGVSVTLIDSSVKSVSFLKAAADKMDVGNTCIVAARAEDFVGQAMFDAAISMAVFRPGKWLEFGRNFLTANGRLFLLHTDAAKLPPTPNGLKRISNEEFILPWSHRRRGIAVYRQTPER